ncbi:MAG: 1-deoxy-D-xylulose 5-phosphate reductoisomerase [bacterium ADurb.Bin431]|nr:MAG: 1-deoxy-D-xylulose 5-phosphate reductoisomerase [bacterium ADurb.Bin431]
MVVHPKSIVHSFVQFRDGSLMAQLGAPDMRLPIQYALTYPERWELPMERVDLTAVGKLEFFAPRFDSFPSLRLAYAAGRRGGTAPAILNAANEVAVPAFLARKIDFPGITRTIETVLEKMSVVDQPSLEQVIEADRESRRWAEELIARQAAGR